jgi:hypothetical protein
MDPVDVLTFSVTAAQAIRRSSDPERVIAAAYALLDRDAPDPAESMAVRVARLMDEAGDRRRDVLDFLTQNARGPFLNRPVSPGAEAESDPEADRLAGYVNEHEGSGRSMFGRRSFGVFEIATRSVLHSFGGRTLIKRNGERMPRAEAGQLQPGDEFEWEPEGLPVSVRCLLDYPLGAPVLFTIETGSEPWSVWDICCAIASQYAKIYEHPERYGVWGHDITDLVIENLIYYPDERLIYPQIGS